MILIDFYALSDVWNHISKERATYALLLKNVCSSLRWRAKLLISQYLLFHVTLRTLSRKLIVDLKSLTCLTIWEHMKCGPGPLPWPGRTTPVCLILWTLPTGLEDLHSSNFTYEMFLTRGWTDLEVSPWSPLSRCSRNKKTSLKWRYVSFPPPFLLDSAFSHTMVSLGNNKCKFFS